MIGGLIVSGGAGGGSARVIVRAIGPSLGAFGIANDLQDPNLELHDASGATIASNENWKALPAGGSQKGEIEATGIPPHEDSEAALVRNLAPGNYTAIVRGQTTRPELPASKPTRFNRRNWALCGPPRRF